MNDDKVARMPGMKKMSTMENDPVDKKVELERLNTLLDATSGALQEAAVGGLSPEEKKGCLSRAKRLQDELERSLEALGIDEPETHMVRVRGKDGLDQQHEVTFPIYATGESCDSVYRMIDERMTETTVVDDYARGVFSFKIKYNIDFLDGSGPDYWLGKGAYMLDGDVFYECMSIVKDEMGKVCHSEDE